jgi:methionine-rich copper-binding protein CopC
MNVRLNLMSRKSLVKALLLALVVVFVRAAEAQPTIVSTSPNNGATGVPTSASLIIRFSEAMDSSLTIVYLVDSLTLQLVPASPSWSAADTQLTCTPSGAFPVNRTIWWTVMNGQNLAGTPLIGSTGGSFTTTAGSQLTLMNAGWSLGIFGFDVSAAPSQTLTVEYKSALNLTPWQPLVTTNSGSGVVHIVDPQSSTNNHLFYRARTGS